MKIDTKTALALFHTLDQMRFGELSTATKIDLVRMISRLSVVNETYQAERKRLARNILTAEIEAKIAAGKNDDAAVIRANREFDNTTDILLEEEQDIRLSLLTDVEFAALIDANVNMTAGQFALLSKIMCSEV
jgi:hypothetical protein